MAFEKKPVDVGSYDGVEERETTVRSEADTIYYPGYVPQYRNPRITHVPGETDQVKNHIDRGGYSHGVEFVLDGEEPEMPPKDQYKPVEIGGPKEEVYPEKDHRRDLTPVPVEIVNRDPIQRTSMQVDTYFVGTPVVAGSSQNQQNGLTPVRILSADPHRVRAQVALVAAATGNAVLLGGPTANPAYGAPIPVAATQYLTLSTDGDVWVSGQTANDTFTVVVISERKYNADPQHGLARE